jgi:hypothetical protein
MGQEETMKRYLKGLYRLSKTMAKHPFLFARMSNTVPSGCSAHSFSRRYADCIPKADDQVSSSINPLWEYFQNHKEGRGLFKWEHYFDIYHRHFARFVGQKVNVLEIGIYSGGSLEMWQSYFGKNSHVYGIDIEEACKVYESDQVSVFIGDQADRTFWRTFKKNVQDIDILIDDGGHTPEQQQITLEEVLPYLRPGGVYLCEDIHGSFNKFSDFAVGLVHELNSMKCINGSLLQSSVSRFQSSIHSIHFYPYVVVIEKHRVPVAKLSAPKHGTEWQPFL